jgi:hypothetical protein
VGELRDANDAGGAVERVTIAEAAALLGRHPNTVRSRVKAGMYRAEKVHTENGPTWMIERDSLTDNAPTTAPQQIASGVPAAQQEAIQELARAIVREAGIARDPEQEARLEGNKMAGEAAKALVLVGSGLLVGMGAVVGVMPDKSLLSPLLYAAFAFILLAIMSGIGWMYDIARATASPSRDALLEYDRRVAGGSFMIGVLAFSLYVLWNNPGHDILGPETPREQTRWFYGIFVLAGIAALVGFFLRRRRAKRQGPDESESPPSQSA